MSKYLFLCAISFCASCGLFAEEVPDLDGQSHPIEECLLALDEEPGPSQSLACNCSGKKKKGGDVQFACSGCKDKGLTLLADELPEQDVKYIDEVSDVGCLACECDMDEETSAEVAQG